MAKTDINRLTGRYGPPIERVRKIFLEDLFIKMDRDERAARPRSYVIGPKKEAIKAYMEGGREKAYSVIQSKYTRNNGETAFSISQIDKWIDEYEENKKKARDDDDAR